MARVVNIGAWMPQIEGNEGCMIGWWQERPIRKEGQSWIVPIQVRETGLDGVTRGPYDDEAEVIREGDIWIISFPETLRFGINMSCKIDASRHPDRGRVTITSYGDESPRFKGVVGTASIEIEQ